MLDKLIRQDVYDILTELFNYDVSEFGYNKIEFLFGSIDKIVNDIAYNSVKLNNPLAIVIIPQNMNETYNYDLSNKEFSNFDVKIYLMLNSNIKDNEASQLYNYYVRVTKDIWHSISISTELFANIKQIETSTIKDHINWGLIVQQFQQSDKVVFNNILSGIEIDTNISTFKKINSKCNGV